MRSFLAHNEAKLGHTACTLSDLPFAPNSLKRIN